MGFSANPSYPLQDGCIAEKSKMPPDKKVLYKRG